MNSSDMLHQLGLHRDGWKVAREFRPVTDRSNTPQRGAILIKEKERSSIQAKQLRHLAQGTMQGIAEVERLRQRLSGRIEYHEFRVAATNFVLRLFPLGDVQQKSLIRGDVS